MPLILPGKYVDRMYQEKKMSVKVKDVGSYKIHVKESSMQKTWDLFSGYSRCSSHCFIFWLMASVRFDS